MPDRTTRMLLWLGAALCFAFGVSLIWLSLIAPTKTPAVGEPMAKSFLTNETTNESEDRVVRIADFDKLWAKKLQRPIVDPVTVVEKKPEPAPEPAKPKPEPPPPPIRLEAKLIGTLVDADASFARAWIELQGKPQVVVQGDVLKGHPGNPTVASIHERHVVIAIAKESHTLPLSKTTFASSSIQSGPGEGDRVD